MNQDLFRLETLTASGFRCFEQLNISFDRAITVIAADNGGGKSAILDLVAAGLGPYPTAFQLTAGANLGHQSVRLIPGTTSKREVWPQGIKVECSGYLDGSLALWGRELGAAPSSRTTTQGWNFFESFVLRIRKQLALQIAADGLVLPLVAYYGTGRLWAFQKLTQSRRGGGSQTEGYRDCLNSSSGYKSFHEWFRRMSYGVAQSKQMLEAQEVKTPVGGSPEEWLNFVSTKVSEVLEPQVGVTGLHYDIVTEQLLANDPRQGTLPVDQFSDGVRAMLALVGDIAYRIVQLNAHLPAAQLAYVPGIVLIDEVDLHLHPTWQQTVLKSLREAFPNIQWIVTTHSPQVLSTVPKHQIRVLEWEGAKATAVEPDILQTQGVESSEILSQVMGTNPTPPVEWAKDLSEYRSMVSQGQGTGTVALALRERLESHFGAGNQVFQASDVILAWRARQGL